MRSRHWWNGRWARLSRRDVFIRGTDGRWLVELRRGGPGGRSRTRSFDSETEALCWVERVVLKVDFGWREVNASRPAKVARGGAAAS